MPTLKELQAQEARSTSHGEQFPSTMVSSDPEKSPHIWWLKTTHLFLEVQSLTQVSQG